MRSKARKIVALSGIVLVLGLSLGFVYSDDKDFRLIKSLDVFYSLFRELNLFYVDETDPEDLIETGINSMLESLDPYTVYIPESEMDDFNFMTTGKYGGIGSLIRKNGDHVIIAEPYEGSPAAGSGLRAGDVIISVDGFQTKDKELQEISEKLKGTPGTEVVIEIKKPGSEKTEKVKVVREQIRINNVSYSGMLDDKTAYIRLSNFTFGAADEVRDAYLKLREEGAEKLMLDLRGNPGGLLIEAVRVCNLFIPKGELIVSTKGKVSEWDQKYQTSQDAIDTNIPLIILVNRSSASASEIVAGAVQDLDRGLVFGQRTFGKGLVQTTRKLKYNSQLKVTTAKYYIPSGRCIQALDYSHRNEDGSVGTVPDSLISEFTTKKGRKVYDGGGIFPDIPDTAEFISQFAVNLYAQNLIFDFATNYLVAHPEKPDLQGFSISDEDYQEFSEFVKSRNFSFETASEKSLKELVKKAKAEKYYERSEEEFKVLAEKLKHDNDVDLKLFRDEVMELLNEEIIGRYYFQSGRIAYALQSDKQAERALEAVTNEELYKKLLARNRVIGK